MSFWKKAFPYAVAFLFVILINVSSFAGVSVSNPTNGATVGTSVHYVASASSSCSKGVSAIGIYTADNALAHVSNGAKLDATLNLSPGTYKTTVQEWDNCGGTDSLQVTIHVTNEAGVNVNSPAHNSTVASPVRYSASSTTGCSKGVSAVGIYTADNVLAYTQNGSSLNTTLKLNPGNLQHDRAVVGPLRRYSEDSCHHHRSCRKHKLRRERICSGEQFVGHLTGPLCG